MRRAEDEAHRLGAGGAADDAAALLRIDALRVAASRSTKGDGDGAAAGTSSRARCRGGGRRAPRRGVAPPPPPCSNGRSRAFGRDAGLGARRSKTNAASRDADARGERSSWTWRRRGMRRRSWPPRRAAGGVRASLAEEATELAREEARARREAAEAFAARDAATGAAPGRSARRRGCQTSPRESHWVRLIGCHRESSRVSRSSPSSRRCTGAKPPGSPWTPRRAPARSSRAAAPPPGRGRVPRRGHQGDRGHDRGSRRRQGKSNAVDGRAVDRAEAEARQRDATGSTPSPRKPPRWRSRRSVTS